MALLDLLHGQALARTKHGTAGIVAIARTEIAFVNNLCCRIEMHIAEGASYHTSHAANAPRQVHHYDSCLLA